MTKEYKNKIENQTYDKERSLYNLKNTEVLNCVFAGLADGESVLKECRSIKVNGCKFSLRYPLWHVKTFELSDSLLDEKARAPIWYSKDGLIKNCEINSIKCLRECKNIKLDNCNISSDEFGWKSSYIEISNSNINSVYFLFESKNIVIKNLKMSGKYSFQYMKNVQISDSELDTKDAFWHSKNVTVKNSVIKGEYLGWFSDGLTLINCKIIGTQPLCYCKNLKLINCEMIDTDLSFEYSDVNADIKGQILSVKNPKSGIIKADSVGEIITEDSVTPCRGKVVEKFSPQKHILCGCAV